MKTKMQPENFIHDISDYPLIYQEDRKKYTSYQIFIIRQCFSKQWKDIWS